MAEADIYIDCDSSRVVTSDTDNTVKSLPRFVQGDTILCRIFLLKGYNRASSYEQIPTDGLTIQAALGNLTNETIYAAQYSWTPVDGLYFEAAFPMNTAELDTALGSASVIKNATFEVKYIRDGVPTTVLQETVSVTKALINPDSIMPIAEPTPLSAEAAQAAFVRKTETEPVYLQGADGSLIKLWNDNGTFRADPVV